MPITRVKSMNKAAFEIPLADLTKLIDVDDNRGRSVPSNMNFIEEGFLTKDTGTELFGPVDSALRHSMYHFKKKDGTSYFISALLTKLQVFNFSTSLWEDIAFASEATITTASPGVVTIVSHGLAVNDPITFSNTGGTLPTGIATATTYYVIAGGLTADAFQFSLSIGGSAVNTSAPGSGTNFVSYAKSFSTGAEFGFYTYLDVLYGGNAVDPYFSWTGESLNQYTTAPKGNILEVFEDRMMISGVIAEPYSIYPSNVGDATTFDPADVITPLGTDIVTNLKNYYGTLLIFKQFSIWKVTYQYDQVVTLFVPKVEIQSKNYGCASRKGATWVENDIWFFTGRQVRSIGFTSQQIGVLGIDKSVISSPISETLKYIDETLFSKCVVFYENSKFYLSIPLNATTTDTTFVSHLLYNKAWTKYEDRDKGTVNDFVVIDEIVYTTNSSGNYGTRKWDTNELNDQNGAGADVEITGEVFFRRIEGKNFNGFRIYRYLDLDFKDLQGDVTVTIRQEASNVATIKTGTFHVGNSPEGEEDGIGEVPPGQLLVADSFGETVYSSPFVKRKVSFLSKAQALIIGLSNTGLDETFTIAQMALSGMDQPRKLFSASNITSV